jgi:uncharacterized RDD family membrane protein YckC
MQDSPTEHTSSRFTQDSMAETTPFIPSGYRVEPANRYVSGGGLRAGAAYGSFFARFAALVIDGLIIAFVLWLVWTAVTLSIEPLGELAGESVGSVVGAILVVLSLLVSIVFPVVYHVFQETGPGQATLGKQIMGLRVITTKGHTLSSFQSAGRCLARYFLSGAFMSLGYFLALLTDRKQALHDLLLGTIVVKE